MVVTDRMVLTVGSPLPETVVHEGFVLKVSQQGVQPGESQVSPGGGPGACQQGWENFFLSHIPYRCH